MCETLRNDAMRLLLCSLRATYAGQFAKTTGSLQNCKDQYLKVESSTTVMPRLAARLNRDHSGSYLVINLSGTSYDTYELQG